MKAIIDGKRYDTETAECVASWSNGLGPRDFKHCDEGLYRTKAGSWFLRGSGGPLSSWSKPYGNNGSQGGEGIRPLGADEALEWLERHGENDAIEEHFADKVQDA
jgi:hypothetical protein